ncbi:hypothetical protein KC717_00910 [Candidatus Dojkabacteria bacterium]|uniref:3'-5' exonuclease domain-containing protein n=1 Tax=Candidatus Dojkabacteria bacterium TaxID=2099670 RepID=A0A955L7L3_9BACT|nr:hypothetical protein [Candidatus Dojkabacteria bacterium]
MRKTFKVKNPYRLDQDIQQDVHIGTDLTLDYSNSPWVALDTEYLSFNPLQDQLCVIQICSKESEESDSLRVEILYVFDNPETPNLNAVLENESIEKIFHVYTADMHRIELDRDVTINGAVFDTKVAARIAWTNTRDHGMKSLIRMFVDPNFDQKDTEKGLGDWEVGPEQWTNEQVYYMMQDVLYLDALRHRILEMAERRGSEVLIHQTMEILPRISDLYKFGFSESILGY